MYYRFKFDGKKFNLNQNSKMIIECKKAINKVFAKHSSCIWNPSLCTSKCDKVYDYLNNCTIHALNKFTCENKTLKNAIIYSNYS